MLNYLSSRFVRPNPFGSEIKQFIFNKKFVLVNSIVTVW